MYTGVALRNINYEKVQRKDKNVILWTLPIHYVESISSNCPESCNTSILDYYMYKCINLKTHFRQIWKIVFMIWILFANFKKRVYFTKTLEHYWQSFQWLVSFHCLIAFMREWCTTRLRREYNERPGVPVAPTSGSVTAWDTMWSRALRRHLDFN